MHNIFCDEVVAKQNENFTTLLKNKNVTIEKINSNEVKNGEWYDQEDDEWVVLLEGAATIEFEDKKTKLKKGDILFIPKHQRHRVLETSLHALWLAVHIG